MFDIISFIREKIFRRPKLQGVIPGEELSEKQTTKLGYFLLFCMFSAILSCAQWTLSIIRNIPEVPTNIPYCVTEMLNTLNQDSGKAYYDTYQYGYTYSNNSYYDCVLVSSTPKFDLTNEYNNLKPVFEEVKKLHQDISTLESSNYNAKYQQDQYQRDYETSLMEKMAEENSGIYNRGGIQSGIKETKGVIATNEQTIEQYKNSVRTLISTHAGEISALEVKAKQAQDDYRTAFLLYKFYVALLSLVYAVIVFWVLYKWYVRLKLRNSPYTIIFSVATFAYGLVLLQISSMFIWDILPKKLLALIAKLLEAFTPLIYLVQFLWPIVIVAVFGFLVYKIQKRLYSPQNVLKRFITDKKCPNCGNSVDFTKPFCPLCSHEIQIHCPHCHELTLKGMPHCSNCGGKLPEKDVITFSKSHSLDEALGKEIEKIDITGVTGVRFVPNSGNAFTSNRETIVRVVMYLLQKLNKTSFEPNELSSILEQVVSHIKKDSVKEAELNRVLGKIKSFVVLGGSVSVIKK